MERTKLLTITVFGLLLLNFATIGFLFLSGPKGHKPLNDMPVGRPNPKEIIIERLHFDINQQNQYTKIIQWHKDEIKRLDDGICVAKNDLYAQLKEPQIDLKIKDSLIAVINSNQKQIEATHFKHFEGIKKICYKEQIEDFNELTVELSRIFAANKPPRPRHE